MPRFYTSTALAAGFAFALVLSTPAFAAKIDYFTPKDRATAPAEEEAQPEAAPQPEEAAPAETAPEETSSEPAGSAPAIEFMKPKFKEVPVYTPQPVPHAAPAPVKKAAPPKAEAPRKAALVGSAPIDSKVGIAAVVNDEVVTYSDIRNRMALYLVGAPGSPPPEARQKIAGQVLDRLIDERLQMQEAKALGITVEDTELDNTFAVIARNNKLEPDEFKQKLSSAGVKISTLQDQIRAQLAWSMVVRRKLRPQVNISESEIDSELNRLNSNKGKTEYNVAEILLPVKSPDMDSVVRHDAEKLVADLNHGAPFSQAARQLSQAPGASQGGDIGWVQHGQLEPKLDEALTRLEPGQISAPVRGDKGYYVLFLRDRRSSGAPAETPPQAAAPAPAPAPAALAPVATKPAPPAPVEDTLHVEQILIPIAASEPTVVVDAKIKRAAALKSEVNSCSQLEAKAKDFLSEGNVDLGTKKLGEFAGTVQLVVKDLPVETLSAPVRVENGIAVLMVCSRETPQAPEAAAPVATPAPAAPPPPAPAPKPAAAVPAAPAIDPKSDSAREQIASQLGMKRLDQLQERYLKDLRATAYIEKRL